MKLRQILITGAILGALFTVQAGPGGSGSGESPDKTGIHAGLNSGFVGLNGTASGGIIYTVPAGKRLIIENISAMCFTSTTEKVYRGYVYFQNGGTGLTHHLSPVSQGADSTANFNISLINWSGRLYADAGAVQVGALKSGTMSASYTCYYAISGYLITVP